MLIDEQFRKNVAFLCVDGPDQARGEMRRTPAGSGFFIGSADERDALYLVTARHVVDAAEPYGGLHARVNLSSGEMADDAVEIGDWRRHLTSDVAIAPVNFLAEVDVVVLPFSFLLSDAQVRYREVGEGDDVFFIGLFTEHAGLKAAQPIVRFGNISLMPREPLRVRLHVDSETESEIEAYLVEARSWGGHSGSPAIIYFSPDRHPGSTIIGGNELFAVLGVVQGHYEIAQKVAFVGDILGSGSVPVNAGVCVVVPSQRIIELLAEEGLVAISDDAELGVESDTWAEESD